MKERGALTTAAENTTIIIAVQKNEVYSTEKTSTITEKEILTTEKTTTIQKN